METYFKLKMFMEYIVPLALILIVTIFVVITTIISVVRTTRIEKFFITNGYKRELFDVPSFGNDEFYGWVRESDNKRVDERKLKGLSLKQIKEKYK